MPPNTSQLYDQLRDYSESAPSRTVTVPASFPFSLLIEGPLSNYERAKLIDIISRENMGVREVDLEPQFEGDRVLIPRISEYAGIMLVQALRGTRARMRLGPSDTIFATEDTRSPRNSDEAASRGAGYTTGGESTHPAEALPVTHDSQLPGGLAIVAIDAVTASATLKTRVVEAENSAEYQEVLEALQREIKYKAYRKGADAILNFSVQLLQLAAPSHYRLTVLGSAVKTPAKLKSGETGAAEPAPKF